MNMNSWILLVRRDTANVRYHPRPAHRQHDWWCGPACGAAGCAHRHLASPRADPAHAPRRESPLDRGLEIQQVNAGHNWLWESVTGLGLKLKRKSNLDWCASVAHNRFHSVAALWEIETKPICLPPFCCRNVSEFEKHDARGRHASFLRGKMMATNHFQNGGQIDRNRWILVTFVRLSKSYSFGKPNFLWVGLFSGREFEFHRFNVCWHHHRSGFISRPPRPAWPDWIAKRWIK